MSTLPNNEEQTPSMGLDEEQDTPALDAPVAQEETTPVVETPSTEDTAPVPATAAESADDEQEENRPVIERRLGVNPNATLTREVRGPLPKGTDLSQGDYLAFIGADIPEFNALAATWPNVDFTKGPQGEAWMNAVARGQTAYMRGNAFYDSVTRESEWRQAVQAGAEQLMAGRPRFGEQYEGGKLVGEQALMRVQALMGLGQVVRVPLWHTGIWVTLKAPTEAELLELDRRIANEKVLLGRITQGMIFSNTSVYLTSYLVNFVLAHVYEATVKYNKIEDLKDIIRMTDIPLLLWGMVVSMYPNGYPYRQPCVTDPSKCMHVVEELLALSKLMWTDERALTEWQRKLMVRKTAKFTPEELQRYQDEHAYSGLAAVKLKDGLTMQLKVPTLTEHEQSGIEWVDNIVTNIDQAFGGTIKGEERNEYIMERAQMTALRQYAHWIEKLVIEEGGGTNTIEDPATISSVIETLTSDDEIFRNFFEGMGKYIDKTTISLIAIPKFNCPSCDKPMTQEETKHPHLMPIDISNVFFTLQGHRIAKVLRRQT